MASARRRAYLSGQQRNLPPGWAGVIMTAGDTLVAFGLLSIIVVLTCEACWRARVPRIGRRDHSEGGRAAREG